MEWSLVTAVNNEEVLRDSLLRSPDIASAQDTIFQRGFSSITAAYNDGIEQARSDCIVLAHQDVYFPKGWFAQLAKVIDSFAGNDQTQWAVLGVLGVSAGGDMPGYLYCTGNRRMLGAPFEAPVRVASLDECVLVLKKSSGLRFDGNLPGFHFYGTDICQEAQMRGLASYAFSNLCVHNTNGYRMFPRDFWRCYFYMRSKWRDALPVTTPCIRITRSRLSVPGNLLRRYLWLTLKRPPVGTRVANPEALYQQLLARGTRSAQVDFIPPAPLQNTLGMMGGNQE